MTDLMASDPRSLRWQRRAVAIAAALLTCLVAGTSHGLDLRSGQAWSCQGTQPGTRLVHVIGKLVAVDPAGVTVAHLSIYPASGPAPDNTIAHAPFQANLLTCRDQRYVGEDHAPIEYFEDGYASWRQAFDAGQGGWFTIPVDEAYAMALQIRDRGEGKVWK